MEQLRVQSDDKKNILVVDDDVAIREAVRLYLENSFNVLTASRCKDALSLFTNNPVDILVSDFALPDGTGIDLIRSTRKSKPTLPVILITAFGCEDVAINAIRVSCDDYIKKPFRLFDLKRRILMLLGGHENIAVQETATYVEPAVKNNEQCLMDGIAEYIDNNFNNEISLESIAAMVCMNKYKFCRAFKLRYKKTFTEYLNNIRIKKAAELLPNLSLRVTDIAYHVGYESVTHFERNFKKRFGFSPTQFRLKKLQRELPILHKSSQKSLCAQP